MGSFTDNFNYYNPTHQNDFFWDANIDWHIYEKRERAIGPKSGGALSGISQDSTEFQIRLAKARALDKARKQLLTAIQNKKAETFLTSVTSFSPTITRTVDGQEKSDNEIML